MSTRMCSFAWMMRWALQRPRRSCCSPAVGRGSKQDPKAAQLEELAAQLVGHQRQTYCLNGTHIFAVCVIVCWGTLIVVFANLAELAYFLFICV